MSATGFIRMGLFLSVDALFTIVDEEMKMIQKIVDNLETICLLMIVFSMCFLSITVGAGIIIGLITGGCP